MKIIVAATLAVVLLGAGCSDWENEPGEQKQIYKNKTYGFEFSYPVEMQFVTPSYPNLQDQIIQLETGRDAYPNTNFFDAAFSVSAAYAKDQNECLRLPAVEKVEKFSEKTIINEVEFYTTTSTGAGAGNFYESKIYRTFRGQLCLELNETIHTGNIGNFPENTVTEVDRKPIYDKLGKITESFRFTK